ncbi:hypothetical protein N9U46_01400 [Acidimicrobiaceae bacterium]|nr:hypothetical protein [Acidimicrobiaceae bacterium]
MKKVLTLFLLLIVSCGGSSEETAVQDTTTTTIPPAPTVDFNIVDIYNKNLGSESELCSDATEIETTSEKCLKQYRDNLETVFSFDKSLYTYITELNTYLESYPSAMAEEYTVLFEFLNNQYRDVPETYSLVLDKYFERFGGVPVVNEIIRKTNVVEPGCRLSSNFVTSENTKNLSLIYVNEFFDELKIEPKKLNENLDITINEFSGTYVLNEVVATNYLEEEFVIEFEDIIIVDNVFPRITSIEIINGTPDLSKEEFVTIRFSVIDGTYFKLDDINLISMRVNYTDSNRILDGIYMNPFPNTFGGIVNKNEGYIDMNIKFTDDENEKFYEEYNVLPVGPYVNEYFISYVNVKINNQYDLFLDYNLNKFTKYLLYPSACGDTDSIKAPKFINNQITVTPEE